MQSSHDCLRTLKLALDTKWYPQICLCMHTSHIRSCGDQDLTVRNGDVLVGACVRKHSPILFRPFQWHFQCELTPQSINVPRPRCTCSLMQRSCACIRLHASSKLCARISCNVRATFASSQAYVILKIRNRNLSN